MKHKWMANTRTAVMVLLLIAMQADHAAARYRPGIRWRTIRGPKATIYYPAGHESFARRVAGLTGEVTGDVSGYFGIAPPRVPIVLHPDTDRFNGFYAVFPNRISLFETPVSSLRGFGVSTSDLVDLVYTHEYAHYTHIAMPGRWTSLAARIFGDGILVTNILAPGWIVEGITTNLETRFTDGGRGRSAWFRGVMGSFRERGMWGLSAAGTPSPYAPLGGRFYLSGYFMVEYLNRVYGDDAFARFARYQADHPIRAADAALKHVTGLDPEMFYRDFLDDYTARDDSIRAAASAGLLPEGRILWRDRLDGIVSHDWTDKGEIIALRKGYGRPNALIRIDPVTGAITGETAIGRMENYTPVRFMPDGRLLFGETAYHPLGGGELDTADLVLFDSGRRTREYITRGGHVFSGDVSPDGSRYVAARRSGMWSGLALIDATTGAMRTLAGGEGVYIDAPAWSPGGGAIAAGVKYGGVTTIALVDPDTGSMRTMISPGEGGDLDPAWSPDGRWVVFSSSRNDIWNIYAWERASGRVYRLTSVTTAAWEPRLSPDGRRLSFLTLEGGVGALRIIPFEPANGVEITVEPGEALDIKMAGVPAAETAVVPADSVAVDDFFQWDEGAPLMEAYRPFLHAPYLDGGDRGVGAGLYIAGADPVGINAYEADIRYGFESERPGFDLRLVNRSFWPALTVRLYDTTETAAGFDTADDLWIDERGAEWYADLPVIHRSVPDKREGVYRLGIKYRRFQGVEPVRVSPAADTAFSLLGEFLLRREPDGAARDVVVSGLRVLYFIREQHVGALNADIEGHHTAVIAAGGFASPVRHHGFMAAVSVQEQRGAFTADKESYIPRGYDPGDRAGQLDARKTMLLTLEYRFPLAYPDAGVGMGTVHVHRFEGAFFADAGAGWRDSFAMTDWLRRAQSSVGVSIGADVHLLSLLPLHGMFDAGWNPREREPFIGVRLNAGIGGIDSGDLVPRRFFREPRRWSDVQ